MSFLDGFHDFLIIQSCLAPCSSTVRSNLVVICFNDALGLSILILLVFHNAIEVQEVVLLLDYLCKYAHEALRSFDIL